MHLEDSKANERLSACGVAMKFGGRDNPRHHEQEAQWHENTILRFGCIGIYILIYLR